LLLNPYHDYPEQHLEFLVSGAVRPAQDLSCTGQENARGRATIEVAGLNRPRLVQERAGHARLVSLQLVRVGDAEDNIRRNPGDKPLRQQLLRELHELRRLQDSASPYRLLTAQLIAAHRRKQPSSPPGPDPC
jgi:hypothetical protein